jgi:hypothetical protein
MSVASHSARGYWVLCVICGAGVIALVIWLASVVPAEPCSGNRPWGISPFLAFQLSRTSADIEAVFGHEGDPCRERMIAALDLANKIDLIAFIAIITVFLACFYLALKHCGYPGLARIGLITVAATFTFAVIEALIRLHIPTALPGPVLSLVLLTIADTGKFLGFAVAGLCAGAAMLARGQLLGRLAGAACVVGAFMIALGLNYFPARPALPVGLGIVFAVMLLYAAVAAVRGAPPTTA